MRRTPALAALALLAAACAAPRAPQAFTDFRLADGFAARRPADVAILPVGGALPADAAEALREALRARLLALRYAPVRFQEVAARPGDFRPGGPNAVIEVSVSRWDDAALYGTGTLRLSAEAILTGAGSAEPLYRGTLRDVAVDARVEAHAMEDRPESLRRAAEEAAGLLLSGLPAKGDG